MEAIIRSAVSSDEEAIGVTHAEAWRVAYADEFDRASLTRLASARQQMWRGHLASIRGDGEMWVAECERRVVGFVHAAATETGADGEVLGLYVHPSAWGSGAAQELMKQAQRYLAARDFRRMILWTMKSSWRARRFYEKSGWQLSGGTATRDFGDGIERELVEYEFIGAIE